MVIDAANAAQEAAAGPRYPYRNPQRAAEALASVDDMIVSEISQALRPIALEHEIPDWCQQCRSQLLVRSLPQYDAHREPFSQVSTYLFICIKNFIRDQLRTKRRHARVRISPDIVSDDRQVGRVVAPDTSCDRRIEDFIARLIRNPEAILSPAQVRTLREIWTRQPRGTPGQDSHVQYASSTRHLMENAIVAAARREGVI